MRLSHCFRTNYSMIVATRPEPTVLPPSRYLNSVFCSVFYTFYCGKQFKIVIFVWRFYLLDFLAPFWHQNDFLLNSPYYMVLAPCIKNINRENINSLFSTTLINKSVFADDFLELSLFFKAFRASYSEMICIFPCFCPYGYFTREIFCEMYLIVACHFIQEPNGSPFCFPCGMGIHIHCGTHVRVS